MKRNFTKVSALFCLFAFTACSMDFGGVESTQSPLANQSLLAGTQFLTAYPGNFVASDDDQVCYELGALLGWTVTSEMHGFKIDPPVSVSNSAGEFVISQPYLDWTANPGVQILAVIVKGGPNFNLYDYEGYAAAGNELPTSDVFLQSPPHKRNIFPDISHYNVCYRPFEQGSDGCTPGYWRNHTDRWVIGRLTGAAATQLGFDDTFGVTSGLGATYTLGEAIWAQGGGVAALARHATAALLNANGGVPNADGTTVAYPLTAAEVIARVQAAFADGGDIEGTKDKLDALNNLGCPLSGTPAQK